MLPIPSIPYLPPPVPSYQICIDMEHDLKQSVEFNIISDDQMNSILLRCLINYS